MKIRFTRISMSILAGGMLAAFCPSVSAQNTAATARSRPTSAVSTPDFSGVWTPGNGNSLTPKGTEAPLTAWGRERMAQNRPAHGDDATTASTDPVDKCFPPGIPRLYYHPFPMEILQVPDRVVMVFEYDHFVRYIYTDGRPHRTDIPLTWDGDSIGHWEGGTLVVDTNGFNDKTWLDRVGHPHSEELHLVERFRRTDHDTLVDDMTIEDPKAYTKPWTAQRVFKLKPDWRIMEFICLDNEVNFSDYEKKALGEPAQ
jgi:hypothetical protein